MSQQTTPENQESQVQNTDDAELQSEDLEGVAGGTEDVIIIDNYNCPC